MSDEHEQTEVEGQLKPISQYGVAAAREDPDATTDNATEVEGQRLRANDDADATSDDDAEVEGQKLSRSPESQARQR